MVSGISENGEYIVDSVDINNILNPDIIKIPGLINTRRAADTKTYEVACKNLAEKIWTIIQEQNELVQLNSKNILVLGTEECMYPAIFVGAFLEKKGFKVKTHSTTRSPIAVSKDEGYPFEKRYQVCSFYDSQRVTFIYNLAKYDQVIIVTDAEVTERNKGLNSLVNSLETMGNQNIMCVNWIK